MTSSSMWIFYYQKKRVVKLNKVMEGQQKIVRHKQALGAPSVFVVFMCDKYDIY